MESEQDKGVFIVIDGLSGSGKSTQFNLLAERLKAVGYDVASFSFPRYKHGSSHFIKKYLNDEFGKADKISPYEAFLFYALDRYDSSKQIRNALNKGKIVLADGFTGSDMAVQGTKLTDDIERRGFFVWADNLEFQLLNIPRPQINFYLRAGKSNTQNKTAATYDLLCRLFPKDFKKVECVKAGKMLPVPEINNLIWEQLKPLLPARKAHASRSVVVTLGLNEESGYSPKSDNGGVLQHEFKSSSLLLRLQLQRLAPESISHSFSGWQEGNYYFYTPANLPREVKAKYKQHVEQLSVLHQRLHKRISDFIARDSDIKISPAQAIQPVVPLGAVSSFKVILQKKEIKRVASSLLSQDSEELQWAAKQLYLAARQQWPDDFSAPLETGEGPAALADIIAKVAGPMLPQAYSQDESIKLLEARPRLEFDLLAESIYSYSSLSLDEISEEVSDWPYSQKYQALKAAAGQSELLSKVCYKLDILSDHLTLDKVIQAAPDSSVQVQSFTPRYGYEMPKLIDVAGADDLLDEIFDQSLGFYSLLQSIDREDVAAYTTLLGHKVRWQINTTAAELKMILGTKELQTSPVIKIVAEKVAESHPILWDIISSGQVTQPPVQPKGKARVKQASRRRSKPKK